MDGDGETGGDGSSGDGDGDSSGDFELVSASLDATGQFVTLHFSEPVAPVDGVDPSDFRISHAMPTEVCGDNGCDPETTYWDANFYAGYYLESQMPDARFEVDLISAGDQATDVLLRFGMPVNPMVCEYTTAYVPGYEAFFVHHSPGDIPVRSAEGEPLAAIGPEWAEEPFPVMTSPGDYLANLDPKIPIPCYM
jgi:hypothetical protein